MTFLTFCVRLPTGHFDDEDHCQSPRCQNEQRHGHVEHSASLGWGLEYLFFICRKKKDVLNNINCLLGCRVMAYTKSNHLQSIWLYFMSFIIHRKKLKLLKFKGQAVWKSPAFDLEDDLDRDNLDLLTLCLPFLLEVLWVVAGHVVGWVSERVHLFFIVGNLLKKHYFIEHI